MSITRTKAYVTTDGQTHATLELAQRAELERMLSEPSADRAMPITEEGAKVIAVVIFARREEFIAILCASGRKPRTKKVKRGKKAEVSE